jgi:hypothetical protein
MEFEPAISEGERPQTHALDRAATGIDNVKMIALVKLFTICMMSIRQLDILFYIFP